MESLDTTAVIHHQHGSSSSTTQGTGKGNTTAESSNKRSNNNSNNNNKRSRSRHAAQNRRVQENSEFDHLAGSLPIPKPISSQLLDKASVVRLTIASVKLYQYSTMGQPNWLTTFNSPQNAGWVMNAVDFGLFENSLGSRIIEAKEGFLLSLAPDGTVMYVSETVSIGLGLSQIEVIGNYFDDYIHNEDVASFHQLLHRLSDTNNKLLVSSSAAQRVVACSDTMLKQRERNEFRFGSEQICLRLKSTLTKRASKDAVKSSLGHKVVELMAYGRWDNQGTLLGLSGLAYTLPSPSAPDFKLFDRTFAITTQLDLTIHYIDSRGEELLGYNSDWSPRGKRLYSMVHPDDTNSFVYLHKQALKLGGSSCKYFRFICNGGTFLFVSCYAIRIHKHKARQSLNYITLVCTALSFCNVNCKIVGWICDIAKIVPVCFYFIPAYLINNPCDRDFHAEMLDNSLLDHQQSHHADGLLSSQNPPTLWPASTSFSSSNECWTMLPSAPHTNHTVFQQNLQLHSPTTEQRLQQQHNPTEQDLHNLQQQHQPTEPLQQQHHPNEQQHSQHHFADQHHLQHQHVPNEHQQHLLIDQLHPSSSSSEYEHHQQPSHTTFPDPGAHFVVP